jgi:hypothetical protein
MAKGKARHRDRPETPLPPPRAGVEESPARVRLRQEQLHRAEVRLVGLLDRLEEVETRLGQRVRDANSLVKELNRLDREANETVLALQKAIRFLATENTAEIIQEEVALAIGEMNLAIRKAANEKAQDIKAEFDKLYEIMIHVRDAQGKKRPANVPDLREMVAGLALDLPRSDPPSSRP